MSRRDERILPAAWGGGSRARTCQPRCEGSAQGVPFAPVGLPAGRQHCAPWRPSPAAYVPGEVPSAPLGAGPPRETRASHTPANHHLAGEWREGRGIITRAP